ncbi:hypothetical protein DFQ01_109129 [Paenibacillus cellulosilyticus]|uniref:Copper amine oxidase-like N-terminal domain-containing protein n=1 Tax=Paenibacillus cellulosilyticus TaxID=375489 RepID=A0A2V2YWV9_9BACL|nr:hypothetical protein [Paenibacillus cellulosilyticus]PWW02504.1 hypothetical protein DFQ01_109129 [Paenibacillus cellulosilyticus]QKS47206.1 hypothetical protein HUB94_22460 [Paenibacillus cellulosilyticus]
MMKLQKIAIPLLGAALLISTTSVDAESVIKTIKAQINYGITLVLNGKQFALRDSKGNELKPIIYDGTAYVPLKALGEALDTAVTYDGVKKQIVIGEKSEYTDLIKAKAFNEYESPTEYQYRTFDPGVLTVNGTTYKSGYVLYFSSAYSDRSFQLNLLNSYTTLKFNIAVANETNEFKVSVVDKSNTVMRETTVTGGEASTMEVPVGGLDRVYVVVHPVSGKYDPKVKVVIGDIVAK